MVAAVADGVPLSICAALVPPQKPGTKPRPAPGAGRRFLCLHGNPSDLSRWDETAPALLPLGEVLAIDLPGYGRSPAAPGRRPTLDWLAEAALAVADAVGWAGPFDVLGQSHGGGV